MRTAVARLGAVALALTLAAPVGLDAQESQSAGLAGELTRLLTQQNLDSIAARQVENRFVAALFFPGTQLLVISATVAVPARIQYLMERREYREAYIDLQSASEPGSKIFISDFGANGLQFRREDNEPFDMADLPGLSIAFTGEWGRGRISEADYRQAFETAEREYTRMLQSLIDQLKKSS